MHVGQIQNFESSFPENQIKLNTQKARSNDQLIVSLFHLSHDYFGIQPTLIVQIKNPVTSNKFAFIRVMIDSGSSTNLITRHLAINLNLPSEPTELIMNSAGAKTSNSIESKVSLELLPLMCSSLEYLTRTGELPNFLDKEKDFSRTATEIIEQKRISSPYVLKLSAITMKQIGMPLPSLNFQPEKFPHLKNLKIAEKFNDLPRPFDLLIGEPFALRLLQGTLYTNQISQPSAIKTPLGIAICGSKTNLATENVICDHFHFNLLGTNDFDTKIKNSFLPENKISFTNCKSQVFCQTFLAEIPEIWQKVWDLSNLGITDIEKSSKEKEIDLEVVNTMEKISIYDKEKMRWSTKLLWKDPSFEGRKLDDGLHKALAIMKSVEKNIPNDKHQIVIDAYNDFLPNMAEIVPQNLENRSDHPTYIIPSRPVLKLDRDTTKARIIINASAVSKSNNMTLNKLLHTGPNLLPQVPALIMKFRHKKFVFTIDVTKMFQQVQL